MLRKLIETWKHRKRYNKYEEMPTWFHFLIAISMGFGSVYYTKVLHMGFDLVIDTNTKYPEAIWSTGAWLMASLLFIISVYTFCLGLFATKSLRVLIRRV